MNLLLVVMSLLMLLTLLTYGRLESFRHVSVVQAAFENYMKETERRYINQEAIKRYESTVATRQEKNEQKKNEQLSASSKLSFCLFINPQDREKNPDKIEPHCNLAKRLISILYGNQPFYRELEEKRPTFVDEILERIVQETEKQPLKMLENIDLGNIELNQVFTKMLRGSKNREASPQIEEQVNPLVPPLTAYPPLKDFITLKSNKLTIRVYLASRPLLLAIYGHHDVVNEIIMARNFFYKEVRKKAMTAEEASAAFETLCRGFPKNTPESMLNFKVTLTNPKGYE